ncbi:MAG: phosphate signaling complex PhoU family protein [Fusobacteriaceae bacterium]
MKNLVESLLVIDEQYLEMLKNIERLLDINIETLKNGSLNLTLYGESRSIEDRINRLDLEIREDSIIALARFQPAASDLRKLIMMTDSARLLERMGDLLKANLKLVKELNEKSPNLSIALKNEVLPLAQKIKVTLSSYVKALIEKNENLLYSVIALDEEIDEQVKANSSNYINYMHENSENIKGGTLLLLLDRKYERFSDHIVHLAKDLIYVINGNNLRKIQLLKNK